MMTKYVLMFVGVVLTITTFTFVSVGHHNGDIEAICSVKSVTSQGFDTEIVDTVTYNVHPINGSIRSFMVREDHRRMVEYTHICTDIECTRIVRKKHYDRNPFECTINGHQIRMRMHPMNGLERLVHSVCTGLFGTTAMTILALYASAH